GQGNPTPINSPLRDHIFVGATSFKVVVDPNPTTGGEVIVYAALSGPTNVAGIWRSLDSGKHWQRMRAGQATDLLLVANSLGGNGNLQQVYGAFRGEGVFFSPNQGQVWNLLAGGVGVPLIRNGDANPPSVIPVTNPSSTPNGAKGRIVLAAPALTGDP